MTTWRRRMPGLLAGVTLAGAHGIAAAQGAQGAVGPTLTADLPAATWARTLPSFAQVQAAYRPSDLTLLDRQGVPVQTLRVDRSVRRLPWVPLQDMSPALLQAIVLSEDRRFHEHSGVDWGAVARSAWGNLWNTRTRGASTLTMQLAGLIDDGLARPGTGRSLVQKVDQAVTATRLDAAWSKSEILEAYLNAVPFRGELVGINALSQTLFGKHPSGLDAHEAAIAAALVRGPNARPETVAARACGVLEQQQLSCVGVTGLAETALRRRGGMPLGEQLAPHFARQVLAGTGLDAGVAGSPTVVSDAPPFAGDAARVAAGRDATPAWRSTLDAGLQRVAIRTLREQLTELNGRNVEDGAIIVLDNASGDVLAWVGSSGDLSDAAQVDGVLARRQPGSTLKPFIYGLAFEKRLITPASLLDDSPAQIATGAGLYLPQNYDRDFKGWVSARTALGASLNVPAVRVATLLGPDAIHARLNALGLALPESAAHYGHSLALGGAEVTLLGLANAYRSLANGGRLAPVRTLVTMGERGRAREQAQQRARERQREQQAMTSAGQTRTTASTLASTSTSTSTSASAHGSLAVQTPPHGTAAGVAPADRAARPPAAAWATPAPVIDPAAAYLVTSILADNNARVRTFGLDSALATRGFAAVKTGTSKDLRDNWCIGFTDRYTVGVWVGNASGEAMHQVSGVSGAAPVWAALVRHLHEGQPSRAPLAPRGVVGLPVRFEANREPLRDEVFIAGTEQALQRAGAQVAAARVFGITSPRDGSIFALDPDMPATVQRIRLEGESGAWELDGRRIGTGRLLHWSPMPGRHTLRLLGIDGKPLQTVRFEVRGATLKTARASH